MYYFENFVTAQINEDRYKNASEVIRGLRLLEAEENRAVMLKKAIQEGLDSPRIEDFDFDEHLVKLKEARRKKRLKSYCMKVWI